jgi:hypothetical protein
MRGILRVFTGMTTAAKTWEKRKNTFPPGILPNIGRIRAQHKEKPFIERFIGTSQKECLDYHYEPMNADE